MPFQEQSWVFMMTKDEKFLCMSPTPGKQGTAIPRWKYELLRDVILEILSAHKPGVLFKDLPHLISERLDDTQKAQLGSVTWHCTTVKLDLEARGEITRVAKASPQQLIRKR